MRLIGFLFAFVLFIVLDVFFLTFSKPFFEKQVMDIQRTVIKMNYMGALLAYLVLIFALYWFILSRRASVLDAAILGGVINGTYELTNMAMLENWHWSSVILDTAWGAYLWGFVTFTTYRIYFR
jgi:uncharacterized membrane protein